MNGSSVMSFNYFLRKKKPTRKIFRNFTSNIVSLSRGDIDVLIGVLSLQVIILVIKKLEDRSISLLRVSDNLTSIPVADILTSYILIRSLHQTFFYHILNLFYREIFILDLLFNSRDYLRNGSFFYMTCFLNSISYLVLVERD